MTSQQLKLKKMKKSNKTTWCHYTDNCLSLAYKHKTNSALM